MEDGIDMCGREMYGGADSFSSEKTALGKT